MKMQLFLVLSLETKGHQEEIVSIVNLDVEDD